MKSPVFCKSIFVFACVFVITLNCLQSQNLVQNPGFEEHLDCDYPSRIDTARTNPSSCPHWWSATHFSGGHHFQCLFSFPIWWNTPKSGGGYASIGFALYSPQVFSREDDRSFLQTKLRSPLLNGCTYEVSFYTKPFAKHRPAGNFFDGPVFTNALGAYLSRDQVSDYGDYGNIAQHKPQIEAGFYLTDTSEYARISGRMVAQGGEQYLTVGVFTPNHLIVCQTIEGDYISGKCNSLFLIDDVSVRKIPTGPTYANLLPGDTVICPGDTIILYTGEPNTTWNTGATGTGIKAFIPGKYWYSIEEQCFTYTDTISISLCERIVHIPNAFTPNNDKLNDRLEVEIYGVTQYRACIYDRWGKKVHERTAGPGIFQWDGKINGKEAMEGIYILRIITEDDYGTQSTNEVINLIR